MTTFIGVKPWVSPPVQVPLAIFEAFVSVSIVRFRDAPPWLAASLVAQCR